MRVLTLAVVLAVAFAGCADSSAPTNSQPDEAFEEFEGAEATSTTGLIRGVVVDASIVPIPDVVVRLPSLGLESTTTANGAFLFKDLEPGSYFLEATKVGYDKVQASASVEAGVDKPPVVRIQLTEDPGSLPIVVETTFNGFIQCSIVTPAVRAAVCAVPGIVGVDLGDDFITYLDVQGAPDFAQAELLWDSTQPLGDALALQNFGGSRSSDGPSPQMINGDNTYWAENTVSDAGEQISFRVFAGGLPDTQAGGTWGFGFTLQQPFEMYITIFYNAVPPEGWWFTEDGSYTG